MSLAVNMRVECPHCGGSFTTAAAQQAAKILELRIQLAAEVQKREAAELAAQNWERAYDKAYAHRDSLSRRLEALQAAVVDYLDRMNGQELEALRAALAASRGP